MGEGEREVERKKERERGRKREGERERRGRGNARDALSKKNKMKYPQYKTNESKRAYQFLTSRGKRTLT